jgi:hypothetical protein
MIGDSQSLSIGLLISLAVTACAIVPFALAARRESAQVRASR